MSGSAETVAEWIQSQAGLGWCVPPGCVVCVPPGCCVCVPPGHLSHTVWECRPEPLVPANVGFPCSSCQTVALVQGDSICKGTEILRQLASGTEATYIMRSSCPSQQCLRQHCLSVSTSYLRQHCLSLCPISGASLPQSINPLI